MRNAHLRDNPYLATKMNPGSAYVLEALGV
jgi:hypothetical protein